MTPAISATAFWLIVAGMFVLTVINRVMTASAAARKKRARRECKRQERKR